MMKVRRQNASAENGHGISEIADSMSGYRLLKFMMY
jgi:hypothetical protein